MVSANPPNADWKGTTPVLRKILEDTGKFDVRVTEEFRGAGPETLAPYDVVVVNYSDTGRPERRWGTRADTAPRKFSIESSIKPDNRMAC